LSDVPIVHADLEILIAVGPTSAAFILGVRGVLLRDLAGDIEAERLPLTSLTLFLPHIPKASGLWVWAGPVAEGSGRKWAWPMNGWRDGSWRRATIGDFQRFGFPTPLPRVEEGTAT
jgi:hypothetical protein